MTQIGPQPAGSHFAAQSPPNGMQQSPKNAAFGYRLWLRVLLAPNRETAAPIRSAMTTAVRPCQAAPSKASQTPASQPDWFRAMFHTHPDRGDAESAGNQNTRVPTPP